MPATSFYSVFFFFFGMIGVRGQERFRRTLPVPFPPFVGHVSDALRGERDGEEGTVEQTGGLVLVRTRHPQMLRGGETRGQGLLPLCPPSQACRSAPPANPIFGVRRSTHLP